MWAAGYANDVPARDGLKTVAIVLENKARIDLVDARGRSALMIAAGMGHGSVVEYLLNKGADSSLRDKDGKSALDLAISAGNPETVQILAKNP